MSKGFGLAGTRTFDIVWSTSWIEPSEQLLHGCLEVPESAANAGAAVRIAAAANRQARWPDQGDFTTLLAIARNSAPGARFKLGSVYDVALEPCETILALGEPLTCHGPDIDADAPLRAFCERAARALPPGGLMVFELIEAEGAPLDGRGWSSADDWAILHETREDRAARRLTRYIETFRRPAATRSVIAALAKFTTCALSRLRMSSSGSMMLVRLARGRDIPRARRRNTGVRERSTGPPWVEHPSGTAGGATACRRGWLHLKALDV